jgi:tRNA pseudouridine38-40 synthase
VRDLTKITVTRSGRWVTLDVTANAFLMHMVRNITGTLAVIGRGEASVEWLAEVLESRDRTAAGVAAPPHGLTLVDVAYPASFGIPPAGC